MPLSCWEDSSQCPFQASCSPSPDQFGPAFHPWGLHLQKNSLEVDSKATVAGWDRSAWSTACPEHGRDVRGSELQWRGWPGPEARIGWTGEGLEGGTRTQPKGRVRK